MATNPQESARVATCLRAFGSLSRLVLQPLLLLAVGALLIFLLGVAQRTGWIALGEAGGAPAAAASEADVEYICPMFCVPPQNDPGRCAVCSMELVPATSGDQDSDGRSIQIDPASRRVANIRTAPVQAAPTSRRIRAVGQLRYDEGALATISSYVDGRIERLYADFTGMRVDRADPLALVYSPPLYSAQVELLQARSLRNGAGGTNTVASRVRDSQERLYQASRRKLIELGMTESQVAQLEQSGEASNRLTLYSPIEGTVIERLAAEGQYVATGEPIYQVADLSQVWLMLDLFPEDAAAVRYGQRVEAEVQSLPGRRVPGRVAFIDPVVNSRTRTVGVRVVLPNEDGRLRIGDFARARIAVDVGPAGAPAGDIYDPELAGKWISPRHPHVIEEQPGSCRVCGVELVSASRFGFAEEPVEPNRVMVAPRDAVLMAGEHSLVYVEVEAGRFEIRPVVLGPTLDDRIVILEGIEPGEEVAVSGNFLIDSQMQLAGNPSLIDPTRAAIPGEETDGPLPLETGDMQWIAGEAGQQLERLYEAYFAMAATLADDQPVPADQARALYETADQLALMNDWNQEDRSRIEVIAESSRDLDRLSLRESRVNFKPISKSVLQLAARTRAEQAETSFIHFYCSMVPGGEGDWLQPSEPLANPYWGSEMLRCGVAAHELAPEGVTSLEDPAEADEDCCGTAPDGTPQPGEAPDDEDCCGTESDGMPQNGEAPDDEDCCGTTPDGTPQPGEAPDDEDCCGTTPDGTPQNGEAPDDEDCCGTPPDALPPPL